MQYDLTIESCTVHKLSEKIDLPSKQTTKIHKKYILVTIKCLKFCCVLRGDHTYKDFIETQTLFKTEI